MQIFDGWVSYQEGLREMSWHQAAGVMQAIYENNRNPKYRRRPFSTIEFLPRDLARKAKASDAGTFKLTPESLRAMKGLFTEGQ